ncbi:MAG: HAD-IIIA family hydrolase [bacterium]|nr:HAD-IIIA family hydrolase [bacterium]
MNKAVFLDRDGTIIEDAHYLNDTGDIRFIPGVVRGLKRLQEAGFLLVIITNQSGIGRGYFSENKLKQIHRHLLGLLEKEGVLISRIYFAPYYGKSRIPQYRKGAFLRKPGPGMLLLAEKEMDLSLSHSFMLGDKDSDIGAGIQAGLKCNILIGPREHKKGDYAPDARFSDFEKACEWILEQEIRSRVLTSSGSLRGLARYLRKKKKRIVTTNGVFDIIHIGHLRYLEECRKQGDVLIVGVNADQSVKQNKGDRRPVNNQFSRAEVVCGLKPVDYAFIFSEKDPRTFLKLVKPDVHIKGGDYSLDRIIEKDVVEKGGGRIELVKMIRNHSTTRIIRKLRKLK